MEQLNKLFERSKIGNLRLKNRAVMPPIYTCYLDWTELPNERFIQYYEERAKGGMGMIIVQGTCVDSEHAVGFAGGGSLETDMAIGSYGVLTERLHKYDCKVAVELHMNGANSVMTPSGPPWAPSDVKLPKPTAAVPHPMTVDEIKILEQKFIDAASRAKEAGFDAVELHAAHSYVLYQFLSPHFNTRTDEYGGPAENRTRIIKEIIAGIKARCGRNYPVFVRFPGDEFTPHIEGTYNLEEGVRVARCLEAAGADALDVSNGNPFNPNANCEPYSYQSGWKKHVSKAIKEAVGIPVIATCTVKDPVFANQMLEEGVCDYIAIGRGNFADSQFMNKAKCGDLDGIRKCIGCMNCRKRITAHRPVTCAVNPRLGVEYIYPEHEKDGDGRPVVVIGGGPSGMQAAKTLADRGFAVTLFEKQAQLGGRLNIADKSALKEKITGLIHTMALELDRAGVDVKLNTKATPEMVKAMNPVGIFMACGGPSVRPKMPGSDKENIVIAEDVIAGKKKVSGKIVIIGSGATGLECAEGLAAQGDCQLTIVEMMPKLGPDVFPILTKDLMTRIDPADPTILLGHKLTAFTDAGVKVQKVEDGSEFELDADYVVLAMGVRPDFYQLEQFEEHFEKIFYVGDAFNAGDIPNAIHTAFVLAYGFDPSVA